MDLVRLAHVGAWGSAVTAAAAGAATVLGWRAWAVGLSVGAGAGIVSTVTGQLRRDHRQRAMYASLIAVSSSSDVRAVLTTVARRAADGLGAIDGVVMIRHGEDLRTYSGTRLNVEPVANAIGLGAFTASNELPSVHVIRTGEALQIPDVSEYTGPPGFDEACRQAGVRAVLCVPVKTSSGTTGSLNLGFARPTRFRPSDLTLAAEYADQAGTGLERALVFEMEQEARRALRELDDLKVSFLASVTNELQTPLTSICGYSELLFAQWDGLSSTERREFLGRIAKQSKVLAMRFDDLLEVRGMTSTAIGRLEPIDLRLLVLSTVAGLLDELDDRKVSVEVEPGAVVWTRPTAFERVLRSLLTNAVQYSPVGSVIRVAAKLDDEAVTVDVTDEGIGIRAIDTERIFDPFYRVGREDTTPPGAGLGLALSRRYVEAMGGRLWVTSESGVGSTFSFTLRRKPRPQDDPDLPTVESAPGARALRITRLVGT